MPWGNELDGCCAMCVAMEISELELDWEWECAGWF